MNEWLKRHHVAIDRSCTVARILIMIWCIMVTSGAVMKLCIALLVCLIIHAVLWQK